MKACKDRYIHIYVHVYVYVYVCVGCRVYGGGCGDRSQARAVRLRPRRRSGPPKPGLGFRISDFLFHLFFCFFWFSGPGFWVLGGGWRVVNSGFRVYDLGFRAEAVGLKVEG